MARFSETFPLLRQRMKLRYWPAADQAAWEAAKASGGLLDPVGPAHHWARSTQQLRESIWGNYLSCLVSAGELDADEAPWQRVTVGRVGLFITAMRTRLAASSVHQALMQFSFMVQAMAPEHDWSWIRRHRLRPTAAEVRASMRDHKEFDPIDVVAGAISELERIDAEPPRYRAGLHYRDHLMVAFVALHLVRRENLTLMTIGKNLLIGDEHLYLVFTKKEVKNYTPIDGQIAPAIDGFLRRYLTVYRPILLKGEKHDRLWVAMGGQPLGYVVVRNIFMETTRKLIGIGLTPHDFRHGAATAVLRKDPRALGQAAGMLSHRALKTVRMHYDHSGPAGAQRIWRKLTKRTRGSE